MCFLYMKNPNSSPSSFRSKLGSYCTGLAIGFILLGFFMYKKHMSQQQASQQIQQEQQQQQPPSETTP